MNIGKLL